MSPTTPHIWLGPFELLAPIAAGGMGEVWYARHVRQGVQVAVKVMTTEQARSARVRAAFRNEVQAAAKLNHRGIVMVFDHGVVPPEAELASDGRLVAGSPAFAMELAEGGNLRDLPRLSWPQLRAVLLAVLDALAHAHARGVIHRDLKPANVLLDKRSDHIRVKLTDFGIAHAIDRERFTRERDKRVSGTPHYMAPEQVLGRWRDQGPWTDLYALGCLAHDLSTGRPPFWEASDEELHRCHMYAKAPRIESVVPLPDGYQQWVDRLMEKRPLDRFRLAADAAWALVNLPGEEAVKYSSVIHLMPSDDLPTDLPSQSPEDVVAQALSAADDTLVEFVVGSDSSLGEKAAPEPVTLISDFIPPLKRGAKSIHETPTRQVEAGSLETLGDLDTQRSDPSLIASLLATDAELAAQAGEPERAPMPVTGPPPIPESWRRKDPPRRSSQLVGAGLGLFGLRSIPIADREQERDSIWRVLSEVTASGRAQAIVLRGAAGNGKSRVAEWIGQRAHEVGAALTLRATHSPIAGPADGLVPLVSDHMGCVGLDREEVGQRVARYVKEHPIPGASGQDAPALAELIAPGSDGLVTSESQSTGGSGQETGRYMTHVRLKSPEERYAVIRRLIERQCSERPLIFWLDDVQWGSDAISFTQSLLETQVYKPLPVLVLMTVRDEALVDRPVEAKQLEDLARLDDVETIEVGLLSDEDQGALLDGLLSLEPELAGQIVDRTAGNPLYAIQLVGDWVQRGVLEVGHDGFQLRDGEQAPLPDDIHQLWLATLKRVVVAVSPDNPSVGFLALEVAAALGLDVIDDEWRLACEIAGIGRPDGLVDTLVANRLARPASLGWSFLHGMVRESLQRTAQEAERWADHHQACAEMLRQTYRTEHGDVAERLGLHLLEADELEAALAPLLQGAQNRYIATDFRSAHALLDLRFDVMTELELPARDARWGDGWVRQARIFVDEGLFDEALNLVKLAEEGAVEYRWARVLAQAGTVRGYISLNRGDTNRGVVDFERAVALFKRVEDPVALADCLVGLGNVKMWRRELDEAIVHVEQALKLYEKSSDAFALGHTLKCLSDIYQCQSNWAQATEILQRAKRVFERLGNRSDVAGCLNNLGEIHRLHGDLAEAEDYYRQALSLTADERLNITSTPTLNLALVLIARDEYGEAQEMLTDLRRGFEKGEANLDLLWIYAGLLACAAGLGQWDDWDPLIGRVEAMLEEKGIIDEDIPWCAQLAADLAYSAGLPERAKRAYELALTNWRAASRVEKAAEVEAMLIRLRGSTRKM